MILFCHFVPHSDDIWRCDAYTLFLIRIFFCCTEWGLHGLKRTKCSAVRSCASPTTGGSFSPDTDTSSSAISWPSPGKHTSCRRHQTSIQVYQSIIFLRDWSLRDSPSTEMSFTWQLSHTTVKTWQLLSAVVGKKTTWKHTHAWKHREFIGFNC